MSDEKFKNSVKQDILPPELNFQEEEMLTENLEEEPLGEGALTPAKGFYETVKEYTKEVPVYDEEGNVTGTEIVVTGRDVKWVSTDEEEKMNELRLRREKECFTVINRGQLWYDMLTESQKMELSDWYVSWLNVTQTLKIPVQPKWISGGGHENNNN